MTPPFDFSKATPEQIRAEADRRDRCRQEGKPFDLPDETIVKSEAEIDRDRMKRESEIQQSVVKVYIALGCKVYSRSVPKRVKVTPGQPDLRVFHPRTRQAWEHETKTMHDRPGKLSAAQEEYRDLCEATGQLWTSGGRGAAEEMLIRLGIAEMHGDSLISTTTKERWNGTQER